MGQQTLLSLKCNKGLAEPVSETLEALVLEEGQLATALNCFYSKQGVLRLWRPFLKEVQGGLPTTAVDAIWIDDWEALVILSTTRVGVFSGSPLAVVISWTLAGSVAGKLSRFGDQCLVANGVEPLLAIEQDGATYHLYECGSQGGYDQPAASAYAPSISIATGNTQLLCSWGGYDATRRRQISFVRCFMARLIDSVGKIYCLVEEHNGSAWVTLATSTNHVLVGALPYGETVDDLDATEFLECDFYFTDAKSGAYNQLRVSLIYSDGEGADRVWVLNQGEEQASAERLYGSASGTGCCQLNGMATPLPAELLVYKSRCFTGGDAANKKRVCVSDVLDPFNFDAKGKGGWFEHSFNVDSLLRCDDVVAACGRQDGSPHMVMYVGTWPEDVMIASTYDYAPLRWWEGLKIDRGLMLISGGRLVFGKQQDKAGGFEWTGVTVPELILESETWRMFRILQYNLLCLVSGQDVLVLQAEHGLWTRWELSEVGAATVKTTYTNSDVLYVLADNGKLYSFDLEPDADHDYAVTVTLAPPPIPPVVDMQLEAILGMPPLPPAAQLVVSGWDAGSDADGGLATTQWAETFTLGGLSGERGAYPLPVGAQRRLAHFILVQVVIPAAVAKETAFALKGVDLFVSGDATLMPKAVV